MKALFRKEAEEWTAQNYPAHVASLKKQAKTHECALARKASTPQRMPTKAQLRKSKLAKVRATNKAKRHAKHAAKLTK